ncbi:MAG: shikimate dehydrogenase [Actinobacteria bacterium]|nr:shikimate dehydrogenase [Actinomycetota bacterium]
MKAAVLGSPVAHSLSPVLHRAAYQALGLTGWSYQAIECDEAGLPGLLAGCGPGWAGLSLTMPLKRAVLPLLDRTEPLATAVGAANTVVFTGGRRHGHNTDVPGMVAALAEAGVEDAGRVLILGAGATACSALAATRSLGHATIEVAARDPARAGELLAAARRLGVTVTVTELAAATSAHPGQAGPDLLISTIPGGAADALGQRWEQGGPVPPRVLDVAYHPWPTRLAAAAQRAGAVVAGGFALLLHQAAGQVELMTGRAAPVEAMRAAGLAVLAARAGDGQPAAGDGEQAGRDASHGQRAGARPDVP